MYDSDHHRQRAWHRGAWLAAGAALVAVLVMVGLIVLVSARSQDGPSGPAHAVPSPAGTPGGGGDGNGTTASGDLGTAGDGGATSNGANGGTASGGDGDGDGDGGGDGNGGGDGDGDGADHPEGDGADHPEGGGADHPEGGGTSDPVQPSPEDCANYDPYDLSIIPQRLGWLLQGGSTPIKLFDTEADAEDGRKIAASWAEFCVIGAGNGRPDHYRYVTYYWGIPFPSPSYPAGPDCVGYQPRMLAVEAHGDDWLLMAGANELTRHDTEADAARAKLVAGGFTELCFIGRDNTRDDHFRYIMTYWR